MLEHARNEDELVVNISGSTIYRVVRRAAEDVDEETGDEGWSYLNVHDLRRSWGGHLLWDCDVSLMVVMEFGDWSDWPTFEEHDMGETTHRRWTVSAQRSTTWVGSQPTKKSSSSPRARLLQILTGTPNDYLTLPLGAVDVGILQGITLHTMTLRNAALDHAL